MHKGPAQPQLSVTYTSFVRLYLDLNIIKGSFEKSKKQMKILFYFRVKTLRKSDHILSLLSIKSATVEDSGNYSCTLPTANLSDTVRLVVVDGNYFSSIF